VSVVVDASVLVAALVDTGDHGRWAEDILISGSLHTPELVRAEATNILRRLERAEQISTAAANAAQDDLMLLSLETFGFDPFAERIWEMRHTVTSYDAWYIALAEALQLPLATLDTKLTTASGTKCRFLTPQAKK
jgi:predicted nucleic acid-binding protein